MLAAGAIASCSNASTPTRTHARVELGASNDELLLDYEQATPLEGYAEQVIELPLSGAERSDPNALPPAT